MSPSLLHQSEVRAEGLCSLMPLGVIEVRLTAHSPLRAPSPRPPRARAVASGQQVKNNPTGPSLSKGMVFVLASVAPLVLPTSTACDIVRGL